MTEEELAAIEARAKAAQAGPWLACTAEDAAEGLPVAFFGRGSGPKDVAVRSDGPPSGTADDDAAFVAAAREDVPALVAEVRRLRGESDRKWLNMVCDRCHVVFGVMCLPRDREPSPVRCDPCSSALERETAGGRP